MITQKHVRSGFIELQLEDLFLIEDLIYQLEATLSRRMKRNHTLADFQEDEEFSSGRRRRGASITSLQKLAGEVVDPTSTKPEAAANDTYSGSLRTNTVEEPSVSSLRRLSEKFSIVAEPTTSGPRNSREITAEPTQESENTELSWSQPLHPKTWTKIEVIKIFPLLVNLLSKELSSSRWM